MREQRAQALGAVLLDAFTRPVEARDLPWQRRMDGLQMLGASVLVGGPRVSGVAGHAATLFRLAGPAPLAFGPVPIDWSDEVDEILGGDLAAGFAYLTPAKGVVIAPMAPLGLRDRQAGTVTFSTSLGLWKKLDRVRRNSGVAIAYHAREHGFSNRPGFVLVQGRASFSPVPDRAWLESIAPDWNRFLLPRYGGVRGRALDVYYWQRVAIVVQVERVLAYPDDAARQSPEVFGAARPIAPPSQEEPKSGSSARVDIGPLAAHIKRLPHTLLGWCGSDDLPEVVPVSAAHAEANELRLDVPPGSVPAGGRRAGLTSHEFRPRMVGQEQRIYTGWLAADGDAAVRYFPHTKAGYRLPPSKLLYNLGCVSLARGMRGARRAGLVR
jgi:hypothetical protein